MATNEETYKALNVLADWCSVHGSKITARVVLISDGISDQPIGIDCNSISAVEELREIARQFDNDGDD